MNDVSATSMSLYWLSGHDSDDQTSLFTMETASVRVHAARRAVFACKKYLLNRGKRDSKHDIRILDYLSHLVWS